VSGVPYRSVLDEDERNVTGAFFRALEIDRETFVGGLLLLDARGEPLEFTYNRVTARNRIFWRDRDLARATTRELLTSLFDACARQPTVVFCLAREVEAAILLDDLDIRKPLARVAGEGETVGLAEGEVHERLEGVSSAQLFWVHGRPSDATDGHRLVERLGARGLLVEPFNRVTAGLREAFDIGSTVDGNSNP
jgi:hypothetical protein